MKKIVDNIGIGVIGAGERGCYILGSRIAELWKETGMIITSVYDINSARSIDAKKYLEGKYNELGINQSVKIFNSYQELMDSDHVQFILITTHTDQHKIPVLYALRTGKKVYLDKPIAVTLNDSEEILACEKETDNTLIMGFTRQYEASWRKAFSIVQEGLIGKLMMIQIRSVIPYTRYFQMWHRRSERSGGALNDKSSHHFDVFNWFAGSPCISLSAIGGQSGIFPSDPEAPLRCSQCDRECDYRRTPDLMDQQEGTQVLDYSSWINADDERSRGDTCVYQPGADIIDHVVCNLSFQNGVKGSLFWSILGPASMDQETLELVGTRGRVLLKRSEGTVQLIPVGKKGTVLFDLKNEEFKSSHYGADLQLVRDLRAFYDGGKPVASSGAGHNSLNLVRQTFSSINLDGERVLIKDWK